MATEKKYFHDKLVLLILSANVFLSIISTIILLLRLGNSSPNYHIIQYRSDLGLSAYKNGTALSLYAFIVFVLISLVIGAVLSYKTYNVRRDYSIFVLGMVLLLIVLSMIVSNALIVLP
jgi:magnesium-transporting ATPase (P-type)